jgi:hypothetical protein
MEAASPTRPPYHPALLTAATTIAVLAAGAALPIWLAYDVGPLEVTGRYTHLWTAVVRLSDSARIHHRQFWEAQWTNVVAGIMLVVAASATGRAVYLANQQREEPGERKDYEDGPCGPVPDGSVPPPPG